MFEQNRLGRKLEIILRHFLIEGKDMSELSETEILEKF
jgi:hypothetical protein